MNEFSKKYKDYYFMRQIGYGKLAKVHSGFHLPTKTKVCIKEIDLEKFHSYQIEDLGRETRIISMLNERLLPPVLSSFTNGTKLFIVRELIDLGSISDLIRECHDFFTEKNILYILFKLLHILDEIHERGLIHRNMNSSNVLINFNGDIKLCGLAVHNELTDYVRGIKEDDNLDYQYMAVAPEIEISEDKCTPLVDVWGLGIILIEMVFGDPSNLDPVHIELIDTIINDDTVDYDDVKGKVQLFSRDIYDLLIYCLRKNPEERSTIHGLMEHRCFKNIENVDFKEEIRKNKKFNRLKEKVIKIPPELNEILKKEKIENLQEKKVSRPLSNTESELSFYKTGRTIKGRFILEEIDIKPNEIIRDEGSSFNQNGFSKKCLKEYKKGRFSVITKQENEKTEYLKTEIQTLIELVDMQRKQLDVLSHIMNLNISKSEDSSEQSYDEDELWNNYGELKKICGETLLKCKFYRRKKRNTFLKHSTI